MTRQNLPALYAMVLTLMPWVRTREDGQRLRAPDRGQIGTTGLLAGITGLVLVIVGIVVGLEVGASLAGTFFGSVGNFTSNVTNANTGIGAVDAVMPALAILAGIVLALGFVFAVIKIAEFR